MIVGLVSCYREGTLAQLAVQSALDGCDFVLVVDAPVAGGPSAGAPTDFTPFRSRRYVTVPRLSIVQRMAAGPFDSDAAKRTFMVERARNVYGRPERLKKGERLWGVWVDGDERLMFPEMLRHYIARGEHTGNPNFPLRLVEAAGGAVSLCYGKVVDLLAVERYVASSYEVQLFGESISRAWGNDNLHWNWARGGNVEGARPPLQGEPHLFHLSSLRPPGRDAERLHLAEADDLLARTPGGVALS
jgi:hypothetical protein